MFKKMMVIVSIMLLPGIVFAQMGKIEELKISHNELCVMYSFMNLGPINDYIVEQGFSSFGSMPLLYGYANKNKIDDKTFWGIRFLTTLSGLEALAPNFLKRDLCSVHGVSKAEMSITIVEFLLEYEVLKFGGLSVDVGTGLGFGGAKLILLGTTKKDGIAETSGRFWTISSLIKPQARAEYHFFEESPVNFILALNCAYNYLPVAGWTPDGGDLKIPAQFDMSSISLDVSITFPFTTK